MNPLKSDIHVKKTKTLTLFEEKISAFSKYVEKQNKNRYFNPDFENSIIRRNFLIKILKPLINRANYSGNTLFLSIAIMDAFLSTNKCSDDLIPTVGIISLTLASKFNEINYIDLDQDFFKDMQSCVCLPMFPVLEKLMLTTLGFNVNVITPLHFVLLFQELGFFNTGSSANCSDEAQEMVNLNTEMLFLFSLEYEVNLFRPLYVALSIMIVLNIFLKKSDVYPQKVQEFSGVEISELYPCLSFLFNLFASNNENSEYQWITKQINFLNRTNIAY